jgi:hypothetical protein
MHSVISTIVASRRILSGAIVCFVPENTRSDSADIGGIFGGRVSAHKVSLRLFCLREGSGVEVWDRGRTEPVSEPASSVKSEAEGAGSKSSLRKESDIVMALW